MPRASSPLNSSFCLATPKRECMGKQLVPVIMSAPMLSVAWLRCSRTLPPPPPGYMGVGSHGREGRREGQDTHAGLDFHNAFSEEGNIT